MTSVKVESVQNVCVKKTSLKRESTLSQIKNDFNRNRGLVYMSIPVVLYYIIFHYIPMGGIIVAFKDFSIVRGVFESPWVGLRHFKNFFSSIYAGRVISNTLLINLYQLIFGFPAPIILALLLNEVNNKAFKGAVQTIT